MLNLGFARGPLGETLVDAGAGRRGGVEAGLRIAEICLGGLGTVRLTPDNATPRWPWTIAVSSPQPVIACLGSQYAGWSLAHGAGKDAFFALGSGPARALAQKEAVLKDIGYRDEADVATLVIESGRPPPPEIVEERMPRLRGRAIGFDGDLRADAKPCRRRAGGRARVGSGVAQGA